MSDDSLERRDVLKLAAGACVVGAQAGCASPSRNVAASAASRATVASVAAQLDSAAADALLAKIDSRMEWIRTTSLPDDVLPLSRIPRGAEVDAEIASSGVLVRKSIRSLYLTGRFLDLPDTMKVHPGMQARLHAIQPEMDDAVLGMTDRLDRMSADDHRRVQTYLEKDDLFGERLAHVLEKTAVDDGLPFQRTFGVRKTVLEMSRRMAAQSPALVTDPLVGKVRRIQAHPRSDAEAARRLAARVGEEAFWAHQERIALLHDAWAARLGTASALASNSTYVWPSVSPSASSYPLGPGDYNIGSPPQPPAPAPPPAPQGSTPGGRTMGTGGIIMGFGLGSVALGAIFYGLASATGAAGLVLPALVLGVTIGPILLVVGLIVVIVGALMKAAA